MMHCGPHCAIRCNKQAKDIYDADMKVYYLQWSSCHSGGLIYIQHKGKVVHYASVESPVFHPFVLSYIKVTDRNRLLIFPHYDQWMLLKDIFTTL